MTSGEANRARAGLSTSWSFCVGLVALSACSGANGADGRSCTVADNHDGTMTVSCEDGTSATVARGADGAKGADGATGASGKGADGVDGVDGKSTLVAVTEASLEQCPDGGKVVQVGVDDGGGGGIADDGILQPGEIDSTTPLCNGQRGASGADGHDALVALADASPVECPAGGKIIQSGKDDGRGGGIADDGILESGEIEVTTPICNGQNGANGSNGASGYNALVSIATATQEQCPTGGKVIGVGIDDGDGGGVAGDGVLQAGEVDSSTPVCNGGSCGVRNNGNGTASVVCDDGSSTTFETGNYTVMDLGSRAGCGIRAGGSVACWGAGGPIPPPSGTFRQVSVGGDHACALRTDGGVSCWGDVPPFPVGSYEHVSTGGASPFAVTCAVKSADRSLLCWGPSFYGATAAPAGTFLQVGTNGVFSCGLRTDRTMTCWGTGPAKAPPPSGTFTKLSVSDSHACALRTNGTAACWGMSVTPAPTDVTFSDVAAGTDFSCGVRADSGAIVCWGGAQPGGPPPAGPFVSVTGGEDVACGVRTDGSVACWGSNADDRATPPAFP